MSFRLGTLLAAPLNRLSLPVDRFPGSGHDTAGRTQGLSVATTNADRLFVRDALREAFAGGAAAYEIAATLVYYGSFGTHIPGQPSEPGR